jgi:hypothetical protein
MGERAGGGRAKNSTAPRTLFGKEAIRAGFEPFPVVSSSFPGRTKERFSGRSRILGEVKRSSRLKTGADKLQTEWTSWARQVRRPTDHVAY